MGGNFTTLVIGKLSGISRFMARSNNSLDETVMTVMSGSHVRSEYGDNLSGKYSIEAL
jgi:hypothetical protein